MSTTTRGPERTCHAATGARIRLNTVIDAASVVGTLEEQKRIVEILRETKGRISGPNGVASRLGVKRSTLLDN